jgi:hypothetical protein
MSALIIFALLTFLMITGMPVSISLGLTVLTFLFAFTDVPLEAVALKLFTGIEKFEIMAIPFFILAGNFLTHGGVAKRMIYFATSMVGHWRGGLGLGGVCLRPVRRGIGVLAGHRGGDRLDPAAGHGQAGLPEQVRRRRHRLLRRPGHPDPAVDRHGDVRRVDQQLDRRAVHGRRDSRAAAGASCWASPPGICAQEQLPARSRCQLGAALGCLPQGDLGPVADRGGHGRHLQRACSPRPRRRR